MNKHYLYKHMLQLLR